MPELPTGTVAFLFTDIEGSTRLWERSSAAMAQALARHNALLQVAIDRNRGCVFKSIGDGLCAAFATASDAVAAAVAAQRSLLGESWPEPARIRVRMAVHTGAAELQENDYFGQSLNRVARLLGAGHGGQILLSQSTQELVRDGLPAGIALRDMGERRLKDLIRPERIFQVMGPDLPTDFPPLATLDGRTHNLPVQLTSFIGRDRDVQEATALLRSSRLVTLSGAGGAGKTRLALQVAADRLEDYADGVWLIEFAPISDARLVPQAVASVLGVKEQADVSLIDTLTRELRAKKLLLVLDNCEHLIEASAALCQALLAACAGVRILATSREALRVPGETSYRVPSLPTPDPAQRATIVALTQYAAVQLFIERARAVKSTFRIDDANAPAVASICHNLDGIPLAIELAAARIGAMTAEEVNERLDQRFRLLRGGARTLLPRQQTLRALIDWSHDLLGGTEQAVLRRLAVFAGGWTLDAAESVCAGGDVDREAVLDLLSSLVDRNLAIAEERDGATRYRLLETVRQYARERLVERDESAEIGRRHVSYYVARAEEAGGKLTGAQQKEWSARLHAERENLLAAHATCQRSGDASPGLRLVAPLANYWLMRGLLAEGYRMVGEALSARGAEPRTAERANALQTAGALGYFMGRYREARDHLEECLAIKRETAATGARLESTLAMLGHVALGLGDIAVAREHYAACLASGRERGDKFRIANACTALAEAYVLERDFERAAPLYKEALAIDRGRGDADHIAISLLNLAAVEIGSRRASEAVAPLQEAIDIAEQISSKWSGTIAVDTAVGLAALRGEWEQAARLHGAVEARHEETAIRREPSGEILLAPLIAETRHALGDAAFAAADAAGRRLSYEEALAELRSWLNSLR